MTNPPIILVPGFWLGAWAWDEVAALLRDDGHDVTPLTLPGLESPDADRSAISLDDHAEAIRTAIEAAGAPVVLAVHSGAGAPGYVASDRVPDRIAAMVYVDSGPAKGAINPDFEGDEWALPSWDELTEDPGNSVEGISEERLAEFRERAVPQPASSLRDAPSLDNEARCDVTSVVICCALSSDQLKEAVEQGQPWIAGLAELRDLTYVDLPTGHWPMWSRPADLARIIGDAATSHGNEP
jgi:pimeloyl-ACP methyl ester carboxylesterase